MSDWTPEQQKAHRAELVTALRSGKLKQTQNSLHDDTGYCCLGVACKISHLGRFVRDTYANGGYMFRTSVKLGATEDDGEMPSAVADYFGFMTLNGGYTTKGGLWTSLVNHNDADGMDFNQIADIIESEPEGMFEPLPQMDGGDAQ